MEFLTKMLKEYTFEVYFKVLVLLYLTQLVHSLLNSIFKLGEMKQNSAQL